MATDYQDVSGFNTRGYSASFPKRVTTTRQTLPQSQSFYSTFSYDPGYSSTQDRCYSQPGAGWFCQPAQGATVPIGKVTSAADYDYTGTLLRTVGTKYSWQTSSSSPYLSGNVLDTPSSIITSDGSGQIAESDYTYDQSGQVRLVPSQSATQGIGSAPGNVYGHITTAAAWLKAGGGPQTHTYWLNTGEVDHSLDANGNKTGYLYSSTYQGFLVTTITNALNQNTVYGYDFSTGLKTSATDPNAQTTTYSYDVMNRVTDVVYPDTYPGTTTHGEMKYRYSDAPPTPSITVTTVGHPAGRGGGRAGSAQAACGYGC